MRISDWSSDVCSSDLVTRWETFTRLVREGRDVADISATFGIPELGVKRILALGNLMPRIRILYRDGEIDATTVRHLTMASKSQQRAWLALHDDPDAYVPTGHQLKAWLFGGQSIPVKHRSEEHTSELQSLMRISYAVFCLKKKKHTNNH